MQTLTKHQLHVQHLEQFVSSTVTNAVLADAEQFLAPGSETISAMLDRAVVHGIEYALGELGERYAAQVLGAERSARVNKRAGYRSGHRHRQWVTPLGTLSIRLVKTRRGLLTPPFLSNTRRFASEVIALGRRLWTFGLSTRNIATLSDEVLGGDVSHQSVADWVQEAQDTILRWLNRPIGKEIRYLILDGKHVSIKRDTANREPVLVAIGITEDGHKDILDVMPAPSESFESWRTLLRRLRARGLRPEQLRLVGSDGAEGLIRAIESELPGVPRQRCTVHKVRNVVGRCPRALKGTAPTEAAAIWKAPNKSEARTRAMAFIDKYRVTQPVLAAIIEDDLDATLTFYDLDAKIWHSLKSTNVLERVNRELERRFRDVGALDGDQAATRIAVLLAIKLNEQWKDEIVNGFKPEGQRRKGRTRPQS